ncbi:hypothetical protein ACFLZL_01180 [Thermodesulfobacteriota bacterium]
MTVRPKVQADAFALLASVGVCETCSPESAGGPQTVTASISIDPVMLGT